MSVQRTSGRFVLALVSGAVLSACSPSASTAVPPVESAVTSPAILPVAAQAIASPPTVAAPTEPLVTGLPDFTRLVETYGPAVVNVSVRARAESRSSERNPLERFLPLPPGFQMEPLEPQPRRGEGSGFIVTPDGYIMTNAHVVAEADEVIVRMSDRRELEAKVVGTDERTDVAVIKVEAKDLPTVRIGDPSRLKPGQWVVAIGSPFGMQNSVTAGIVSATSRDLPTDPRNPAPAFIQTDAAVNPGNSGGPLFNLQGEVVGINSQIYSQNGGYMGLSFAIPIDIADNVREQLVSTGRVTRSRIGVSINEVTARDADAWGLDRPRGSLVVDIEEGSPAEKAGLKPGDIILSVNGRPVEGNSLPSMISVLKPGTTAELEVWRDKKARKLTTGLVEMTPPQRQVQTSLSGGREPRGATPPAPRAEVLGMKVRPLTAEEKGRVETEGTLLIEEVSGPAEDELRPGDIILDVAGTPVKSVNELESLTRAAQGRYVALRIQRPSEGVRYVYVRKQQR